MRCGVGWVSGGGSGRGRVNAQQTTKASRQPDNRVTKSAPAARSVKTLWIQTGSAARRSKAHLIALPLLVHAQLAVVRCAVCFEVAASLPPVVCCVCRHLDACRCPPVAKAELQQPCAIDQGAGAQTARRASSSCCNLARASGARRLLLSKGAAPSLPARPDAYAWS